MIMATSSKPKSKSKPAATSAPLPQTPLRGQKGVLAVLALGFFASGVLRLGGLDQAFAEGALPQPATAMGHDQCLTPEAVTQALARVTGRAEELDAREAALAARAQDIDAAARALEDRLALLAETEARINQTLSLADGAAAQDLAQLTILYEAMDPAAAAELIAQMDVGFAAGLIARLRPEAGAAILSELPTEGAYAISVWLATRNAQAPALTASDAAESGGQGG